MLSAFIPREERPRIQLVPVRMADNAHRSQAAGDKVDCIQVNHSASPQFAISENAEYDLRD